jgi:hypothetical protein
MVKLSRNVTFGKVPVTLKKNKQVLRQHGAAPACFDIVN